MIELKITHVGMDVSNDVVLICLLRSRALFLRVEDALIDDVLRVSASAEQLFHF